MKKQIKTTKNSSWLMFGTLASLFLSFAAHSEVLSLADVQARLVGADLKNPSAESAVGKYLAETHASFVVRSFPNAPVGSTIPAYAQGVEKLAIAVSPETFEAFKKYFSAENYLYQFYEPNDVRMVVGYEGKRGTEGQLRDQMIFTVADTLMVPVLIDSNEAANVKEFFKLAEMDIRTAGSPWRLLGANHEAYSALSAFQGCTHWFGGIPIGTKLVDTYVFPHGDDDPTGTNPNQKPLTPYDLNGLPEEFTSQVHKVWQVPGKQQLGDLLARDSFLRGEFANTGWSIYTLLGTVKTDRVPVVFILVDDETAPLPADFKLNISTN